MKSESERPAASSFPGPWIVAVAATAVVVAVAAGRSAAPQLCR